MKKILLISLLFAASLCFGQSCDVEKGSAGSLGLNYTLSAGQVQVVDWDFTGCLYADGSPLRITDMHIYVTKPRDKRGFQAVLSRNTPVIVSAIDLETGEVFPNWGLFDIWVPNATNRKIGLIITADDSIRKSVEVSVTYTANFGG